MTISLLRKTLTGALMLTLSWSALGAINLADPIPVTPQLTMGKLPNGLTYYIQKNGKPQKHVELRLVVRAGSILEDDDQQGLAHFTEHMAFDGSAYFQKHELISYLESIGVKFGADLNAYTSFDETVYILPIPTDKPENLETGFKVLEDWAQGVSMKDDAIDAERPIVLEEARLGKGAGDRMTRILLPEVFNGSKYAERLPIGKEALLKTFPHSVIRRFYNDWYRPDLMAVVVIGDVEPEQAEKMIKAHFVQLKNPAHERPRDYATIPQRSESNGLVITDKEATNNVVLIRYPVHAVSPHKTIADYRESLVRNLYTAMLGQRMQELTQQENPPFLGASSSISPLARGYESFSSSAVLGRGGVAPAIAAVVQENEKARQRGFAADELDRAKKNLLRFYERAYIERDKSESSSYASEYIRNFLVQESVPGIENEYRFVNELVPGISLDEVNAYARRETPSDTKKLVAYLGSSKESEVIPTRTELLALVDAAEKAPIQAKEEKKLATSLMAQPPKAGGIVAETQNKELGLTELTLSNGIKVVLKPTDFKNDEVLLSASRFGGQFLFGDSDKFNALYANAIEGGMGVGNFTPTDIQKVLAGKTAHIQTSSGGYTDNISGSAGSADIESLFQLLYLRLTSPRRDDALYKAFVSRSQDLAKNAMSRPEAVFEDTVQATLYDSHPRLTRMAKPEDFTHIDLDRAMAIYQQRFGSAKDLTVIMVGSFDLEKIKPLIATYLASLPTSVVTTTYKDLGIRPISGVVKKDVHIGAEPKSKVEIAFTGPATYSLEENTRFYMLLDVMNLKIIDVLREKMSLIYGGGMSGAFNRIPYQNYSIGVNLPCGPENVDKVIAALFAEIDKIKTEGPQQSDVDKVKQQWLEERKIDMRTNSHWLSYLQDAYLYGTDPVNILSFEKRVNAVTADELKERAKRYFNSENYVQTVLYPENKPENKTEK
ncbi:MAG TPA: insulinase family protein [Burkholderiaceae bacterium]|jgi:zinc protease|nr:insulinase family protein [Burkholderiaceae bacterium]